MNEKYTHVINITCGVGKSYSHFKKKFKMIYPQITRKQYGDVYRSLNEKISDLIIKQSFEFKMPSKMGTLSIRKQKVKIYVENGKLQKNKMIVDWGKTWEYWLQEYPGKTRKEINAIKGKTAIYNMNDHTNGYIMRWYWDRSTCNVPNQTVYYFKPTKRNRLELAAWIKSEEKENDYFLKSKYNTNRLRRLVTTE